MIDKKFQRRGGRVKVTFSIPTEWLDRPTSVVGDFNDWDPTATPLRKKGSLRSATVVLDEGGQYAFRYLDSDGRWHDDPAADSISPNPDGGTNCVVDLRRPQPDAAADS